MFRLDKTLISQLTYGSPTVCIIAVYSRVDMICPLGSQKSTGPNYIEKSHMIVKTCAQWSKKSPPQKARRLEQLDLASVVDDLSTDKTQMLHAFLNVLVELAFGWLA